MSWCNTALSSLLWNHEEVKAEIGVIILNKNRVDNRAWRWILDLLSFLGEHEHPLVDSLVDDNKSHRRLTKLVVRVLENLLELRDFLIYDLISHALSNTVSVNDDLVWKSSVSSLITVKCLLHGLVELLLNDFLTFALDDDVRVVLGEKIVSSCCKSNDRFTSSMANIDTNDHDFVFGHEFWHSHLKRCASNLGIDLLHDV